ncbi:uncharacterized protein (DUF2141 family) [Sphingomonas jinjuensis]|uniref:Uncharacterized protein (DUF2141 family) n=1 Tax=Sphingomonas jinjuensis TaxID=535907 RepID=A0A840FNX2_9SPHN|nr:DUF2141 domain-containing protein [Sphingomonas jinjuensis]MBB4154985.1 uncharacterized protein (DUF2141 family) [Sphingomonas jinjuensis]
MTYLTMMATALVVAAPAAARAEVLGSDAAACAARQPSIEVELEGFKDRKGEVKLELYPATAEDFLKDDRDLIKEGKLFRRVHVPTPPSGPVSMCIRVPGPGRYALLATHNRDGKNKFSIWQDGAGLSSNAKLGASKPKVTAAIVEVGNGVTRVPIRLQYLRGLGGFGPIGN